MKVAAVIVTRNRHESLVDCINSLLNASTAPAEIIVVDNASEDNTPTIIADRFPSIHLITLSKNLGPAGGGEVGQRYAYEKGFDAVWMMDDDAKAGHETLTKLLEVFDEIKEEIANNPILSPVACRDKELTHPFYNVLRYNKVVGIPRRVDEKEYKNRYFEVNMVPMCGMFIPRKVFEISGFVRGDFFGWYDDTEFVLRAQKNGFKVFAVTEARIYHAIVRSTKKIFGRNFTFIRGNPDRLYYGTRNNVIAQREFLPWFNFYFLFLPVFVVRRGVSIIFFYENKGAFLKHMFKGVGAALKEIWK